MTDPTADHPAGPLTGYRIVDLSRVVMGPFATQILADQGADVIMIEAATGDTNRIMGPGPHPHLSGLALNMLRNKRSICLDLKDEKHLAVVRELIGEADAVVATMRPDALTRLGLDYESVRAIAPDVVYCQAQGWPLGSPEENAPAYDDIIQAASGIADLMQRVSGEPTLLPTIAADKVCGLAIAQAVTAALLHRERTGRGQHVEVPMVQAMTAFILAEHGAGAIPEPPTPQGELPAAGYPRILTPQRRPQRTADGWIQMLPYSADQFRRIFEDAGRLEELMARFSNARAVMTNSDELYAELRDIALTRTTAEWLAYCRDAGVPVVEVATLQDLVDNLELREHPIAGSYRILPPLANFSLTPSSVRRHAPLIGEHTDEALSGGSIWE